MTRPDWDTYFLGIAEAVAARADCTRSKVGAVLVNARNEIRGTGYNGSPAGLPGCLTEGACPRGRHFETTEVTPVTGRRMCSCDRVWPCPDASEPNSDYSNCVADHAERNALRHSRPEDLKGATLYVTRPPCPSCTTLITACGIVRVVSPGTNRCLGCGEYEGDGDDNCVAQYESHGAHVYTRVDAPKTECTHRSAYTTGARYDANGGVLYKHCPYCKARFTVDAPKPECVHHRISVCDRAGNFRGFVCSHGCGYFEKPDAG